jgi:hypothetical protein
MYPERSGDLGVLHAFRRKGVDGTEELSPLLPRAFLRSSAVQAEVRQPLEMHARSRNELQDLGVLYEYPQDYVPQVLQEMEAIGDLHGVRRRPSGGLRILTATIPAYYLHPRVFAKPAGEGVRAPVWQDVHQRATFEIYQDRTA